MGTAEALLDREMLVTGAVHDAQGALTGLRGLADLLAGEEREILGAATERLEGLLRDVRAPVGRPEVVDLGAACGQASCRVRLDGPVELFLAATRGLPVRVEGDGVEIGGLSADAMRVGWSLDQARAWALTPGPGRVAAHVRVAVRLLGARSTRVTLDGAWARLRVVFDPASG